MGVVMTTHGTTEFKKRATNINKFVQESSQRIAQQLLQLHHREQWTNKDLLESLLLLKYCEYIVMLESRNEVWPYEYMSFARRVGEIWEPFCKIIYDYPINELSLFIPPTFEDMKRLLSSEIEAYINNLPINQGSKIALTNYYNKVWSFVTSGEIQLELDLHFKYQDIKYNVDMKSSFNSNEKGNTNRLLLVGSIYKSLETDYENILFVRADEIDNNHYLQTLKRSGIWDVYTGEDTYQKMYDTTGFDIKTWITQNIEWEQDVETSFYTHLRTNDLLKYLKW